MSDFGSIISVVKKDGKKFSLSDVNELSDKLNDLIVQGEFENALGAPLSSSFNKDSSKRTAIAQLSEHHFGGDVDEDLESLEFVKEIEEPDVQEIIDLLKVEFPNYTFEGSVTVW